MKQREYIKPKMKVKVLRVTLLSGSNTADGPGQDWEAKRNGIYSTTEFQEYVDELNRMFE